MGKIKKALTCSGFEYALCVGVADETATALVTIAFESALLAEVVLTSASSPPLATSKKHK